MRTRCLLLGILMIGTTVHASLNTDGMRGIRRTHSGNTLGHSRMGMGILADGTTDASVFQGSLIHGNFHGDTSVVSLSNFLAIGFFPMLSIGIGDFVDFGVGLPIYYENMSNDPVNQGDSPIFGLNRTGMGDFRMNMKFRLPIPQDEYIVDLALLLGGQFPATNRSKSGTYLRELEYVRPDSNGYVYGFGNGVTAMRAALVLTFDFNRLDANFPLEWHLNLGYRKPMEIFSPVLYFSTAMELYPVPFMSIYAEYMREMPEKFPTTHPDNEKMILSTLNTGGVLHTDIGLEIYLGLSINLEPNLYYDNLIAREAIPEFVRYGGRTTPNMGAFAGFTWNGFLLPMDTDDDGIKDRHDKCPEERGPAENDGCPLPDPDLDKDGICDPWVSARGHMELFSETCNGIDQCPNEAGVLENNGCPLSNPDMEADGVCDPWVAEKGLLAKFANVCTGIDRCPNESGAKENEGCPMSSPDMDGDSVCDPWVAERGMLERHKSACTGIDQCPNQSGPLFNDGCPLPNPDIDSDSICDPWVTERNFQQHFTTLCTGMDKCAKEAGARENDGCPMANPDLDGDGMCDSWVAERGMLDRFKEKCTGIDKCSNLKGPPENEGCPAKPIEKTVNLRGVNFKTGTAELVFEAQRILDGVAEQLVTFPDVRVEIRGHTDSQGSHELNMRLSERRAMAVVDYLISKGVKPAQLKAVGLGPDQPVAPNTTAQGRAENRRIEMYRLD